MTLQEQLESAVLHHRAGRLTDAERIYRQILTLEPNHADALHLLGILSFQRGLPEPARQMIDRAIASNPTSADYHRDLGVVLLAMGENQQAMGSFRKALALRANFGEAHAGMGQASLQMGDHEQALDHLRRGAELAPDSAEILRCLADALQKTGRNDEAIVEYRRLVSRWPDDLVGLNNLASALYHNDQTSEAMAVWRQALSARPDFELAFNNLAVALHKEGCYDQSILLCQQALSRQPGWAAALRHFADALYATGQFDAAIEHYRAAVASKPMHVDAWIGLGHAFDAVGLLDNAMESFERALAVDPECQEAHHNRLFTMLFHPAFDAGRIAREHRSWNKHFAKRLRQTPTFPNEPSTERKLKIAYISPNFRAHCQALFTVPLLAHHDRSQFEVFLYSDVRKPDRVTDRIRGLADAWQETAGLTHERTADLIRADRIDVLIDLTLHMAGNRAFVFARRAAPVQVTWLGYPGTTGLDAVDYRLTDPWLDPPDQDDSIYSEQSIRLPHTFWCYDPTALYPVEELPIGPLPALRAGRITFGSLNDFRKVNQEVLDLWARVLLAVSDSRMIILVPRGQARERVLNRFARHSIDPGRIEFVDHQPRTDYMRTYNRIDLSLDTFPYNGHTTSLDSLWMGVPVVTLVGSTVYGRAGLSQLNNLELSDLVARQPEEFVRIAAALAADVPALSFLHQNLRQRMQRSPLADAEKFARDIEAAYRQMWRNWCAGCGFGVYNREWNESSAAD